MVWFPLILDYSPMLHCHLVGLKESGFGREGSLYGMDDYTVIKSITLGNVYN